MASPANLKYQIKIKKMNLFRDKTVKDNRFFRPLVEWPLRLVVRTPPFHGGNTGSSPVGVATFQSSLHPLFPGINAFPCLGRFLSFDEIIDWPSTKYCKGTYLLLYLYPVVLLLKQLFPNVGKFNSWAGPLECLHLVPLQQITRSFHYGTLILARIEAEPKRKLLVA